MSGKARGSLPELSSEYLESLGYDGLKTIEGGEPPHVGPHDTYLIFDPTKVKLVGETAVE